MSDPISKSSYLPWYFGGGAGVPHFRRMAELAPYETDYFGMELHLGIEPVQFFNVPLLWKARLQSSLLVDGEFSYAGGDEMNLGSHRMMGMAHTGLRMRLFLANRFAIYLDLLAGLGVSHNEMNFGKGIPLPEDTAGNVGGKGELGFEIRVSDNVSLAPAVAFQGDMSFNGETDYTNWMVSGVMGVHISDDDSRSRAFEEAEKEQKKREKKLNEQMEGISEREKELAEGEEKTTEVKEMPEYLPDLSQTMLFPSDNPDIELRAQWFASHGSDEHHKCFSNVQLDNFMRTVHALAYKLKLHPSADYEVIIYVKGYAPDTGDTSHNIKLAMARANAVIQYLTSKKSVDQQSEPQKYVSQMNDAMDNPTVSKGRLEQLRSENVEVELPICGFQDESGSGYDLNEIGLCKADKEGNCKDSNWRIKVINVNDTLPADCNPAEVIKEDFNIENIFDPQDPRFNMVKLDVAVYDRKKQKFYQFRKAEKIEGTDR